MDKLKNECNTLSHYDVDRNPILKDKRKYLTHDNAVAACKTFNLQVSQIKKLVTYKCKVCHNYHIGRNGKDIKSKYRNKLKGVKAPPRRISTDRIKVVGKIDLSKFK